MRSNVALPQPESIYFAKNALKHILTKVMDNDCVCNYSKHVVMICSRRTRMGYQLMLLLLPSPSSLDQNGFISQTCHSGFEKQTFELF